MIRKSVRERLAAMTDSSAGPEACWPWTGGKGNTGTCSIQIDGKTRSARRVLWELLHGPVPEGRVVSDCCNDRSCMNPAHFKLRDFRFAERLWEGADRSGGANACWPWRRNRVGIGYGTFHIEGKGKVQAHRVAWEITNGPIPQGMHVCHHCDNPPCINPKHLFLGTPKDNMQDMIRKGRQRNGRRPGVARIVTPDLIAEVHRRRLLGETQKVIASALGVSTGSVHNAMHSSGLKRSTAK